MGEEEGEMGKEGSETTMEKGWLGRGKRERTFFSIKERRPTNSFSSPLTISTTL